MSQNNKIVTSSAKKGGDTRTNRTTTVAHEQVAKGVSTSSSYTKPEAAVFGLKTVQLNQIMEAQVTNQAEACAWPDILQVVYTFKFPEACNEFRKLFSTDFNIFATDQWVSGFANNRVNVNVNGFGRYVLRCPFVPKALVISVDADAYAYTTPVGRVNKAAVDAAESVPAYIQGSGPLNPESVGISPKLTGNALFRHGVYTNLLRQFILMSMGTRIEFDCDHVVVDVQMRNVGLASSYIAPPGANLLDAFQKDLEDLNHQMANLESASRYVPENAAAACSGDLAIAQMAQQINAAPNGSSPQGDGTIPIQGIVLLAGQGIDVILYTLPGLEQIRDQLLSQACINEVNLGYDLPTAIDQTFFTLIWTAANALVFVLPDSQTTVTVNQNEPIPVGLVTITEPTEGNFEAVPNVNVWVTTIDATVPDYGPDSAAPGTPLPTTNIYKGDRTIGSQSMEVINHGELQMSFNLYGCYIPKKMYLDYFEAFAAKNVNLRTLMLETRACRDVLDSMVSKHHAEYQIDRRDAAAVGVGALPSIKALEEAGDAGDDDLSHRRCEASR